MSKLDRAAAREDCYCVCHSSIASRAHCEHCNGINSVSDFHLRKTITEQDALIASQAAEISALHRQIDDLARPIMEDASREIRQDALIQSMRDLITALPHSIRRLGKFYGYHWHVDDKYFDSFADVAEKELMVPALAQVSASPKNPVSSLIEIQARRDLPLALNLVRSYTDEVWRLVQGGWMDARSGLADIALDARDFLKDLSGKEQVSASPLPGRFVRIPIDVSYDAEAGVFVSKCPSLKVLSQAETEIEAIEALQEAVEMHLRHKPVSASPKVPVSKDSLHTENVASASPKEKQP